MSWPVPIPAAARPAWQRLQAAIDDLSSTPCRQRIEWISPDLEDREFAIRRCVGCPVLRQCGEYAVAARERDGVWGGVDRAANKKQPTTLSLFETPTNRRSSA